VKQVFERLLEYAGGSNGDRSLRKLSEETLEGGIVICLFQLGGHEQTFVASFFGTGDGSLIASLRSRIGALDGPTQLDRLRISDFLSGKYINYAPRPHVDFDEDPDQEIWIEFDSLTSYGDPLMATDEDELLEQLIAFLEEARACQASVLEWQSDLEESRQALIAEWSGGLEEPTRESSYVDEVDYIALANHWTQKLTFIGDKGLRFETLRDAEQYLIDQIPESLELLCEHDGEVFTFENALIDIRNRAAPFLNGLRIDFS
jgi:hypothetical protein